MPTFVYEPTFQIDQQRDTTVYRKLSGDFVTTIDLDGRTLLRVDAAGLKMLARQAFVDISFFLRTSHLQKLADELKDPEASDNDRFVIYTHLQNAVTAAAAACSAFSAAATTSAAATRVAVVRLLLRAVRPRAVRLRPRLAVAMARARALRLVRAMSSRCRRPPWLILRRTFRLSVGSFMPAPAWSARTVLA